MKKYVTSLKMSKKLKKAGFEIESKYYWIRELMTELGIKIKYVKL